MPQARCRLWLPAIVVPCSISSLVCSAPTSRLSYVLTMVGTQYQYGQTSVQYTITKRFTETENVGQLSGSLVAAAWASMGALRIPKPDGTATAGPPVTMLLVSAVLLEVAGRLAIRMQPAGKSKDDVPDSRSEVQSASSTRVKSSELDGRGASLAKASQQLRQTQDSDIEQQTDWGLNSHASHSSKQDKPLSVQGFDSVMQGLAQLLEGFTLIARSGYLCHVCLHFVLHYIVSTSFYFARTLVVATAGGSASQMVATFALMNSLSAGAVAVLQLTATVRPSSAAITSFLIKAITRLNNEAQQSSVPARKYL